MRIYAIGDIHGHLDKLLEAHARIERDKQAVGDAGATVVHLGDLVDRGPHSRGVIDHLIATREAGAPHVVLLGNHDLMMRDFLKRRGWFEKSPKHIWLNPGVGGRETLASYGVEVRLGRRGNAIRKDAMKAVPEAHLAFLDSLPTSHAVEGLFFAHAGVRPGIPLDAQSERDLLWIRDSFLDDRSDHGALVVHGHTPHAEISLFDNRLALDTGAAFGGPLSTVVIEQGRVWHLAEDGRREVHRVGDPDAVPLFDRG